jgi:dihydropteroate synthase
MFTLNCKGRLLAAETPLVMGIVNLTPDSFHGSSRIPDENELLKRVEQMLIEEADIIDIGAQSTRPNASFLSEEEELKRLSGAIETVMKSFPDAVISIDTFYASVARNAIEAGASIVNDISGGSADPEMLDVVALHKVPYVCMHIRGTAQTMHQRYDYHDVTAEVMKYFVERIDACKSAGIKDVIIDPGFGFSKNSQNNFELLRNLAALSIFERPVLVGLSRKSTISKTLGVTVEESLNGTTVLNTIALMHGAQILRVHDVKAAKEAVKLVDFTQGFHAEAQS